ncbi:MAG: UDP-N-acetylglucosamine 2-epimerase [Chlorobiaceae bacterium]
MKKLLLTAGGKPATLLLAPLYDALKKNGNYKPIVMLAAPEGVEPVSEDLAARFGLGEVSHTITLPKGTPAEQLASVMTGAEKIMMSEQPDLVLVCGCDNAALGAAIIAAKLGLSVAAVDAGLRSYERSDADEVNRVVIDAMADFHFVSEHSGEYNLINEGIADEKVFFAGNLIVDSLVGLMEQANDRVVSVVPDIKPKKYALLLLNPAGRFSGKEELEMMRRLLAEISSGITVVMPQHGMSDAFREIEGVKIIEIPAHTSLLKLLRDSMLLLTDIEEMQSEATVMNVPCLTIMESSFRPATIEIGTNVLVGLDEDDIKSRIHDILHPGSHQHITSRSKIPEKWDGAAAGRIVAVLDRVLGD